MALLFFSFLFFLPVEEMCREGMAISTLFRGVLFGRTLDLPLLVFLSMSAFQKRLRNRAR